MLFNELKSAVERAGEGSSVVICLHGIGYVATDAGKRIAIDQMAPMEPLLLDQDGFITSGFADAQPANASRKFFAEACNV